MLGQKYKICGVRQIENTKKAISDQGPLGVDPMQKCQIDVKSTSTRGPWFFHDFNQQIP